ncbi:MAG TPA: DUF1573 domain-containing protein [Phycisphaerae bacterium]|nr:DUF1573 domain-containing protein [Phycisphaerae bacterium]
MTQVHIQSRRHRSLVLGAFTILVALGSSSSAQEPKPPTPPATTGPKWQAETFYDFGEVWAGVTVTKPFEFKNVGNEPLRILEAKPRCSCSVAENYTREVLPGQAGVIPFKLDTTAKNGRVDETLAIKTNDPVNPEMVLRLVGVVKMICRVEVIHDGAVRENSPELMKIRAAGGHFGRVTADQKLERLLRITNLSGSPLTLQPISTPSAESRFRTHFKETKPQQEWELTIRGDPPFPEGSSTDQLLFKTNIPSYETYQIKISAYVPPRVEVIPQKIVIDPAYPPVATRIVRVNNNGNTPLEITAIAASDPSFHLSLMPVSPSQPTTRAVQVIIPQDYRPPEYGEFVRINTTDKERSQIDIPVLPDMYKPPTPRPADKPLTFHSGSMPVKK